MTAMTTITPTLPQKFMAAVDRKRLIDTASTLIAVHSPTGAAGAAADCLATLLSSRGFRVERPVADHPAAPAVVVRLRGNLPGKTLQFNGHLDTVHLPFSGPGLEGDRLTGSGASDMKAGIAAAVEALCVLRDLDALQAGSVLFTAHDLHEAPWGFGQQLDRLIADGCVGDAVLIPEPLCDRLPVIGRGSAVWKAVVCRASAPVHEVMRDANEPNVLLAASKLLTRLDEFNQLLSTRMDPQAGCESVFVGQIHGGEIFNQYPQECWLEGTRRWLPGVRRAEVQHELEAVLAQVAQQSRTTIKLQLQFIRDAFWLDQGDRLVATFQQSFGALSGRELPTGVKPFVDDGNSFWGLARIPAITHGPRAGGQHTTQEWVSVDDMVRVAALYATVAVTYCETTPLTPPS